jgi:hypothetical protein
MAAVATVWPKGAWATAYMPMSNFMLPIVGFDLLGPENILKAVG